jgi:L-ascorbate metabolism protein UlaG (beta-lactamase superfamily)
MPLFSNPYYKGQISDHFDGKRFFNPEPFKAPTFLDVLKWKLFHKPHPWPKTTSAVIPEFLTSKQLDGIRVVFIGHASFLVQCGDCNILIDPIYSKYAGPLKTKMLKRRSPPGICFDKLPRIDLVLLSHSHYDHLDRATLKRICKHHTPLFIAPLGIDKLLKNLGILSPCITLDWNQHAHFKHLQITLTQSQHWSSRTAFDRNMTLWGGFIIQSQEKTLYFAGDTGFNASIFDSIGQTWGPIDLAMLPIGAYKPRWFMQASHMDPSEAVRAHQLLKSKLSLAMHHRCFPLADEGMFDAENDLLLALKNENIDQKQFLAPYEGTSINI